tara:strand:- start:426 stop:632 length:207 start_codon:yes stop_codon:yes gene_type:complete
VKKVYKKHWASPTRIITTKSYKFEMKDIFDVLEIALLSWIGFLLMKILFSFGAGIEALSEIDKVMRGY